MKLEFTASFQKDYRALPSSIQKALDKQLLILLDNLRYPSLRAKKMEGYDNVWEGRITKNYRFTFSIFQYTYIIRRTGSHNILNQP